jgi:CRP/FNR family transcriptional regulator, cyclic AMP receptor protein
MNKNTPATSPEVIEFLASVPDFAALDLPVLEALAHISARLAIAPGQVVLLEGEPADGLYVVEKGWLKSTKMSPWGREQVIRMVGPGDTFNEIGVLGEKGNLVTVVALEGALVWRFDRAALLVLLEVFPALARILTRNLVDRVNNLFHLVEALSLQPVDGRLAQLLLDRSEGGVIRRRSWFTQAEMAAIIGTVPDMINRILHRFETQGLILLQRHQIQILDPAGLAERIKKD